MGESLVSNFIYVPVAPKLGESPNSDIFVFLVCNDCSYKEKTDIILITKEDSLEIDYLCTVCDHVWKL